MMSRGGGAADPTTNNEWPYHNNDNNNDDDDDDEDVRFNRPAASSGNTVANHHPHHHQLIKIEQYVHDVLDYSSQYGSDMSISYTAHNVIGTPSQFPDYGDFPETFAMRTYGPWWDTAPSRSPDIMPQTLSAVRSTDYIVVSFEEYVYADQLCIFETYNPGAVVQVWAYTMHDEWQLLWLQQPQSTPRQTRLFTPPIRKISVPTRIIRLDFNHQRLHYFTQIDAIMLTGVKYEPPPRSSCGGGMGIVNDGKKGGPIQRKLDRVKFKPIKVENHAEAVKDFLVNRFENFIVASGMIECGGGGGGASSDEDASEEGAVRRRPVTLNDLPVEILFNICSHLDVISLFRLSATCRTLRAVSTDPILYKELNLKPYWHLFVVDLFETLTKRCHLIRKLDISWCDGLFQEINEIHFQRFVTECCGRLTHLRLNSVKYLTSASIELIGQHCAHLQELSMQNFPHPSNIGVDHMSSFRRLRRLDLSGTTIAVDVLLMLLRHNPQLEHLNLGFFDGYNNMDRIAIEIATSTPSIVSLDMWKSHSLSAVGLAALAQCSLLEEVDFGWCLRDEAAPGDSLKSLVQRCTRLRRLCLSSIRGLTDSDLAHIAEYGANLEQLDLMGVMGISSEMCLVILQKCKRLKLLDLSFCYHLDDCQIAMWKEVFHVDIKRSYVPQN